jgi:Na+/H+ antiporter NhaC
MIGVIACSGGMEALVQWLAHRVRSRRGGRLLGWLMGLIIFFDDYANCLLVGTTLRPFTDRLRISREKLSFIVDATGAPVATIAIVSTWIGYQLSQLEATGFIASGQVYDFFLRMLPYSFYSYFTVAFVFLNALLERDFGPMYWAELRAARDGLPLRPGAVPLMDADAMMPPSRRAAASPAGLVVALGSVVVIIIAVLAGLYLSGRAALGPDAAGANLRQILGASNPYQVLLWASFGAGFFAILASLALRVLSVGQAVDAWVAGVRSMMMAMIILVLAWTLGTLCREYLYTGPWLASQFQPPAVVMPAAIFLLCCLVSLATGTSFGTMAIVFPVATPMVWAATTPELIPDVAQAEVIRVASLAAVLSGAVFGDHCSPVSDTTILSSMASAADHIDHVRTQMPYAIVCAAVALLCGYVPATRGVSPVVSLAVGIFVLAGVLRVWGRPVR